MRRLRIFVETTINIRSRTNWNGTDSLPRSGSMNLARPFKAGNETFPILGRRVSDD